ncbi:MAG TPA: FAD-dependent monooxygenase [Chryseolinea sp.]|nr:FAD-dependent monooxygenase [Chryseolinea sp.]
MGNIDTNKSARPDVLIVGAGPTGLMMACQLARLGVNFRIIEKNRESTTQSRALAIHAGSMEIFSQMGIADDFINLGKKVKAVNYLVKGNVEKRIALSEFGKGLTQFPFLLILEQSKTERLLIAFLEKQGHSVEWQTEIIDFKQDNDVVQTTLLHLGSQENVKTNWLVGADGARSQVRQTLDIPFGGQTYPIDLFALDCKVNWKLKEDEMYIAFSDHSFAGFFPMSEERCRVIGFVPKEAESKDNISFEDINIGFAERMQMNVELYDPSWISTYHSHHRYVSQFKIGRCFLTGDAAHIHSPVGAQGMNTGLQDAFNLAWKLAFTSQKKSKEILLSTYEEERLPFARRLVKSTDRAFNVTVRQNPIVKYIRMKVAPHLLGVILKIKFFERFIFRNISQIGITYQSRICRDPWHKAFSTSSPKPGERLPYIEFENIDGRKVNIQQRISGLSFHLFLLSGPSDNNSSEILHLLKRYNDSITFEIIQLVDNTQPIYESFGIKNVGLYLIRPDYYIAYRSNNLDTKPLEEYLSLFLNHNN